MGWKIAMNENMCTDLKYQTCIVTDDANQNVGGSEHHTERVIGKLTAQQLGLLRTVGRSKTLDINNSRYFTSKRSIDDITGNT
jgi:hypothetical protein